jgi:acyl-CoA synthetase (NDP forming)
VSTAHDAFGDGGALHAIFHPSTIAIVGATAEPSSLGHKALAALRAGGFEHTVVAVDSHQRSSAFGIRVYRELEDIPGPVDLAVVATFDTETLDAIEKCAGTGVKGVVVLSGVDGPAEHCRDFARMVRERLRQTRTRLIGPGCWALMNPSLNLNVSPG